MTKFGMWLGYIFYSTVWFANPQQVYASDNLEQHNIRYPQVVGTSLYQNQSNYFVDVLKLVLERSPVNYQIEFVDIPTLAQSRSQSLIIQGFYDIHWLTTNTERESILKPIRIPLYKGLLGLRIAFVNASKANQFAETNSLEQLRKFYVGQGRDWVDSKVLRSHGFRVEEASTTIALFEMLQINRIDYFPRSVLEIWWEAEQQEALGLSVDPHIALYYPAAVYFFVRKDDTILYDHVLKGLNKAIADGSFEQNFIRYFGEAIKRANVDKRKIFNLTNPFIPTETPLEQKQLWQQLPFQTNAKD